MNHLNHNITKALTPKDKNRKNRKVKSRFRIWSPMYLLLSPNPNVPQIGYLSNFNLFSSRRSWNINKYNRVVEIRSKIHIKRIVEHEHVVQMQCPQLLPHMLKTIVTQQTSFEKNFKSPSICN